jgi:hypothetical protein
MDILPQKEPSTEFDYYREIDKLRRKNDIALSESIAFNMKLQVSEQLLRNAEKRLIKAQEILDTMIWEEPFYDRMTALLSMKTKTEEMAEWLEGKLYD